MTVQELVQWLAYFSINPSGESRADWRIGQLASLVGNMFGGKLTPKDFMWRDAEPMTDAERSAAAESQMFGVAAAMGVRPSQANCNGKTT